MCHLAVTPPSNMRYFLGWRGGRADECGGLEDRYVGTAPLLAERLTAQCSSSANAHSATERLRVAGGRADASGDEHRSEAPFAEEPPTDSGQADGHPGATAFQVGAGASDGGSAGGPHGENDRPALG